MYEELVCTCRPELWFWDSVVLLLTLALAASQVFATALDTYFQLTIMLMILTVGVTVFAHFQPFTDDLLQRMQVSSTSIYTWDSECCVLRCLFLAALMNEPPSFVMKCLSLSACCAQCVACKDGCSLPAFVLQAWY